LNSINFSDKDGYKLFNKNIDLIPLDLTIYGGMSGGPLIDQEGNVIGILSGSYNEGGSIAWAIPSKYLIDLLNTNTQLISLKDMKWPELKLMSNSWDSLRKYYNQSEFTIEKIIQIDAKIKNLQEVNSQLFINSIGTCTSIDTLTIDIASSIFSIQYKNPLINQEMAEKIKKILKEKDDSKSQTKKLNTYLQNDLLYINDVKKGLTQIEMLLKSRFDILDKIKDFIINTQKRIRNSDISEKELDKFEKDLIGFEFKYSQLFLESFEKIKNIDEDKLIDSINIILSRKKLEFESIENALSFNEELQFVSSILKNYSIIENLTDYMNEEEKMFLEYLQLISPYLEYVLFQADNSK